MTRRLLPLWILLALGLLLLLLHLALPHLVRNYLNDKMADMGDYQGHVEDVDLAWWRGAYRIEGLLIEKKDERVQAPLFKAPGIDIAISWNAILDHQEIVGEVAFEQPHLNFVDGGDSGDSQSGEGVDWRDQLEALVPITLNEIRVVDGQLSFRNFSSDPQVHVYASDIQATLYNLTNTDDADGTRTATFEGTGKLFDQAPIEASARFDPFTDWEDFEVDLRVTDVPLKQLNDFSRAYGNFDFAGGTGDLVLEVAAKDSQLDGYIKPLLRDVDVFDYEQDVENDDKGFLRGLWEAVVGGGQEVLQNQRKDQFATRVELSGTTKDTEVSPFQAFIAILRNGFVEAFTARFERAMDDDE
ncbi:DUF748 domain-containing protein [Stutzerimonas frequens]|uniref:DUF748 domain-containing protein n=1 Tax=Stutzerimonas frequens TaxID=2968969 RepID=A0AA47DY95_9GAMM|nr:DUF748 domain-containing protein [Stutzerimonas frequens]WAE50777.1 DUF748 domain-containing protein [Stutzerimonas frequens]